MIRPPGKLETAATASSETRRLVAWLNRLQEFVVAITPLDSPTSSPSITTKGTYHRAKGGGGGSGSTSSDLPAWL